ncbi:hypothetical protein [Adoxophyes orana nucleopolyhedrovirus]|uniref:hypothetical protein n=1 Tax=Adoxophyes orana nucleopolyhedrovirus TaxID=542343 RepID=UPI0001829C3F|nr:hypothetical protein [Adoxophyes orana nucleopolyhedrovirus]ACF05404.1 hypothetical protein [Adoxophyes orana nucleopolyhedrovirus]
MNEQFIANMVGVRLPLEIQRRIASYLGPVDYKSGQAAGLFLPDNNYFMVKYVRLPFVNRKLRTIKYLYHQSESFKRAVYFHPDSLYGLKKEYQPENYANFNQICKHIKKRVRIDKVNKNKIFYDVVHNSSMKAHNTRHVKYSYSDWESWLYYCTIMIVLNRDENLPQRLQEKTIKEAFSLKRINEEHKILVQSPKYMFDVISLSIINPWDFDYIQQYYFSARDVLRNKKTYMRRISVL